MGVGAGAAATRRGENSAKLRSFYAWHAPHLPQLISMPPPDQVQLASDCMQHAHHGANDVIIIGSCQLPPTESVGPLRMVRTMSGMDEAMRMEERCLQR